MLSADTTSSMRLVLPLVKVRMGSAAADGLDPFAGSGKASPSSSSAKASCSCSGHERPVFCLDTTARRLLLPCVCVFSPSLPGFCRWGGNANRRQAFDRYYGLG